MFIQYNSNVHILINSDSANGFVPSGTKSLPAPIVDLSPVKFCGIHMKAILHEMCNP